MDHKSEDIDLLYQLLAQERFPNYFKMLLLSKIEKEEPSEYWIKTAANILANEMRIIRGRKA